jgi:hypothetical protein
MLAPGTAATTVPVADSSNGALSSDLPTGADGDVTSGPSPTPPSGTSRRKPLCSAIAGA